MITPILKNLYQNPRGMIALSTVLLVGAIVLVAGLGMTTRSIMTSQTVFDTQQSRAALAAATACMERALASLFLDSGYAGNEVLTIGDDSCTILPVESPTGTTRIIKTQATASGFTRKILVNVSSTTPPMTVSSWQDTADF